LLEGDYNLVLATVGLDPLAGRNAFSGYSGGYVETVVDLGSYAGRNVRLRFRLGTDSSNAEIESWRVDDVQIIDEFFISNTACLNTSELYNYCDTIETPVLKNLGQTATIDQTASGETTSNGSVAGTYLDTLSDNGQAEALTEEKTGGKPKNRKSLKDHQWHFDVTAGNLVNFLANAWAPASLDGDTFEFTYSINGSDWLPLAEIAATFDDGSMLTAVVTGVSGPVSIRLTDTDRQVGNRDRDTAYVDYLLIRTESFSGGSPPAVPVNLTATPENDGRIDLLWEDQANDEFGFQIERSSDQVPWGLIATISANSTSFVDNTVQSNTAYYYRIRAYNNYGSSTYSNSASATTPGSSSSSTHIGDLDGQSRYDGKRRWLVEVTITVHDDLDLPVAGTTVFSS